MEKCLKLKNDGFEEIYPYVNIENIRMTDERLNNIKYKVTKNLEV